MADKMPSLIIRVMHAPFFTHHPTSPIKTTSTHHPSTSIQTTCSDLTVNNLESITFQNIINFICGSLQNENVTAFDYEDEDGDMITVRSDDEMFLMISSFCYNNISEDQTTFKEALLIRPKIKLFGASKNKKKLKIETTQASMQAAGVEGSNKRSGNMEEILALGGISSLDISLVSLIASGSCGSVYKGKHKRTGACMAVKVIALDVTRESQQQIISELDILHQCQSEVIISFMGAYFEENRICICTEYMNGGSLDRYREIPEGVVGCVCVCILRGLHYLWSRKILHRDVKPSNMLVNTEGAVKLCDFGISVQLIDSIAKTFIGTNAYMAPERIQGHDYSIHSEVWSLGLSVFELAAGHFPYQHSIGLWKSIVDEQPPQLSAELFSPDLVHFVSKCMQKDPEERPKPESLMEHSFPQKYIQSDSSMVANWMVQQLHNNNYTTTG